MQMVAGLPRDEWNKRYLNEAYAKQRAWMLGMLGGACVQCGATQDLEIDHIDWRAKSYNIGRLWPWKRLGDMFRELAKCQILCHEHHHEKSKQDLREIMLERSAELGMAPHGGMTQWMKKKCRCDDCNESRRNWYDERNARRRLEGTGRRGAYKRPAEHGDPLRYTRGCRCELCRAANSRRERERKAAKAA